MTVDACPTLASGRTFRRSLFSAAAVAASVFGASAARAQIDVSKFAGYGLATYNEIDRTLRVSGTRLYGETASLNGTQSGGLNGRSFVWPASTQFRVLNALAQLQPTTYAPYVRLFSDQLQTAYYDNGYRSGAGGGARFYDDNAHVVVALAEAYRNSHDSVYLDRAKAAYGFVKSGEDTVAGGGIYFQQGVTTSKDAISTLQGARAAAMLYRATGQQTYLDDATRLMTWANSHIQQSNGLYNQGWVIADNAAEGVPIVNSAGIGISANLELYDATSDATYLNAAKKIALSSLTRFFDSSTGQINDEGYWAFELVDGYDNLYLHDYNSLWLSNINKALTWLHDNKQDVNGHYDTYWGRNGPITSPLGSWNLNEQASVAQAYLYTALVPEPTTLGLLASLGTIATLRRRRVR